jgi:hypothetical protein
MSFKDQAQQLAPVDSGLLHHAVPRWFGIARAHSSKRDAWRPCIPRSTLNGRGHVAIHSVLTRLAPFLIDLGSEMPQCEGQVHIL